MPPQLWMFLIASLLTTSVIALVNGESTFDPFSDAIPYAISWPGQAPTKDSVNELRLSARVKTKDNENYVCTYDEPIGGGKAQWISDYSGPSINEVLQAFYSLNSCSYRIESYWAYELCHGRHFRQYHELKDATSATGVTSIEYFLGFYKDTAAPANDQPLPKVRLEGEDVPYYEQLLDGGTACDLTGAPRRTRVLYVCHADGRGELYDLTETSSCEYRAIVLTSALCQHPAYRREYAKTNTVSCYAVAGSPAKPRSLVAFENESERWRPFNKPAGIPQKKVLKVIDPEEEEEEDASPEGVAPVADPYVPKPASVEHVAPPVQLPEGARTDVGAAADEALLREFLSGSYCIQGGSGWWQHEFCFGRHAVQFHPEAGGRRSDIVLGRWDEREHLAWLERNPSKRPKPRDKRKATSLFHTNGDICDLTGKPRVVEVKLKCAVNAGSSHYVSVYLLEPRTCEYIMTIESPILCKVVAQADDNGIFKKL